MRDTAGADPAAPQQAARPRKELDEGPDIAQLDHDAVDEHSGRVHLRDALPRWRLIRAQAHRHTAVPARAWSDGGSNLLADPHDAVRLELGRAELGRGCERLDVARQAKLRGVRSHGGHDARELRSRRRSHGNSSLDEATLGERADDLGDRAVRVFPGVDEDQWVVARGARLDEARPPDANCSAVDIEPRWQERSQLPGQVAGGKDIERCGVADFGSEPIDVDQRCRAPARDRHADDRPVPPEVLDADGEVPRVERRADALVRLVFGIGHGHERTSAARRRGLTSCFEPSRSRTPSGRRTPAGDSIRTERAAPELKASRRGRPDIRARQRPGRASLAAPAVASTGRRSSVDRRGGSCAPHGVAAPPRR